MIQLNWYKIFGESHQIPDGRTVTPTDDIQIWLHCADIWDKTYTTLAEVLADTSTLVMLMAIDNAVDYLVRSTTWIGNVALVPKMTSNTTPSGECFANYANTSGTNAIWRAFNRNKEPSDGLWYDDSGANNPWIGYDFETPVVVNHVDLTWYFRTYTTANSLTAQLQGSNSRNDGYVNIGDAYIFSGIPTSSTVALDFSWDVTNATAYRYHRIYFNQKHKNGGTDYTCGVEVQFAYNGICQSEIAMKSIGASDYASNTLLADSTWNSAIHGSSYSSYVENVSVPQMTGDTTPSGYVASANNYASGYNPYKAFDENDSTCWKLPSASSSAWLKIQMPTSFKAYLLEVLCDSAAATCTVKDSSNNTIGSLATTSYSKMSAELSPDQASDNYTFEFTSPGSAYYVYTLQIYGREIGGVQTWLRSANITDKTYTTLSEVLADTATLSALMSNHNAVDYLVTAKGWADDICADSTAMTYIGQNNYCANTLIADETWLTAIANSTYRESVFNIKVPAMTSDTAPKGVCFAGSVGGSNSAYKAFDGNNSNEWLSGKLSAFSTPQTDYIGYQFDTAECIKAVYMRDYQTNYDFHVTYTVSASNDGVTYTNLYTENTSQSVRNGLAKALNNNTNYAYYKLTVTMSASSSTNSYHPRFDTIQFYGREDV